MPQIMPVSDLRNKFANISRIVHETAEPIFLTKNGYGDMVVMSMEAYEKYKMDIMVFEKLKEAALEARSTNVRYDFDIVAGEMREKLIEK
jgi:prevent-host-death family protein